MDDAKDILTTAGIVVCDRCDEAWPCPDNHMSYESSIRMRPGNFRLCAGCWDAFWTWIAAGVESAPKRWWKR